MIVREYLEWHPLGHEVPILEVCNNYIFQNKQSICEEFGLLNPEEVDFDLYTRPGFGMETGIIGLLNKKPFFSFRFEQMPGCCAIGVTSYLDWDKHVPLDAINRLREALAKECNWGVLLANLTEGQKIQREALRKRDWDVISVVRNPKTANKVFILQKEL